jgi:fused-like protein
MDQYQILERIGEGSFGRVYKARRKHTGQFVAMKFMSKAGPAGAVSPSEAAILAKLDHPNIVALLDHFETARDVVLVMEYAYGELFAVLCEDKRLPEPVVQGIARQLVSALHYLHSQRIMHRDMKPQVRRAAGRGRAGATREGIGVALWRPPVELCHLCGAQLVADLPVTPSPF